jgi:hypothetical protein
MDRGLVVADAGEYVFPISITLEANRMQNLLGEGATIVPFIIASDQTHLTTLSGSKVAWPVYASIGNISKDVRSRPSQQAMMLIGYIHQQKTCCYVAAM